MDHSVYILAPNIQGQLDMLKKEEETVVNILHLIMNHPVIHNHGCIGCSGNWSWILYRIVTGDETWSTPLGPRDKRRVHGMGAWSFPRNLKFSLREEHPLQQFSDIIEDVMLIEYMRKAIEAIDKKRPNLSQSTHIQPILADCNFTERDHHQTIICIRKVKKM